MLNLAAHLPIPRASQATPGPLDPFWYNPVAPPTASGIVVKPDIALKVGAVFACVRVRREALGSLPWQVFEQVDDDTAARDPKHYLWKIFQKRPNRWQTPMEWKEMGSTHVDIRGNFYCHIVPSNDPKYEFELWPLNPDRMQVDQLSDQTLRYTYSPKPGNPLVYPASEIFHVRGLCLNGITGVSIIEYAAMTIGLSIAQQTHGASLFRNGGLPTFWIKRPAGAKWTKDAIRNFRGGWRKLHAGPENAGNPPILQDGMELHELGLSNRDTQWIESLNFNALDICRFFGVPPHMIGVQTEGTYDPEQLGIEFVRYALGPHAVRFEEAAGRDLMLGDDEHFVRINLDALERGQRLPRYQANNIAIQGGWKTKNEVRAEEGLNALPGGDELQQALNMQPAGGGPDWNEQGGQPGKGTRKRKKAKPPIEEDDGDEASTPKKRQQGAADEMDEDGGNNGQQHATRQGAGSEGEAALRATFEPLFRDAAQRIAAAEIRGLESRADKASIDRAKWNEWAAGFYADHARLIERTLAPIVAAWQAATGRSTDMLAIGPAAPLTEDVPALIARYQAEADGITFLARKIFAELRDAFYVYDPDQPRDDDGKFGSGGGKKSKASQARADRAKQAYSPATKEKQDQGDLRQRDVARILGHTVSDDNSAMDVLGKDKDGKNTAVEVKTLCDAKNDKLTMRSECRERKEAYGKSQKATLYTVAVDDRDTFEGGKHGENYSGDRYHMREGVGSFRLSNMTPVTKDEMRKVVRGEMKLNETAAGKKKKD